MSDDGAVINQDGCLDYKPVDVETCENPKCRYGSSQTPESLYEPIDCENQPDIQCNLVVQFGLCNNDYYQV